MKILVIGGNGYIGSTLLRYLRKTEEVNCIDLDLFTSDFGISYYAMDYNNLPRSFLEKYELIILLAGHSSVNMCAEDTTGGNYLQLSAYKNNVLNFSDLLEKIGNIPLIYASSASVYGADSSKMPPNGFTEDCKVSPIIYDSPKSIYDVTKSHIDSIATYIRPEYNMGLRFGTLCGIGNATNFNLRRELLINSMTMSALEEGYIRVQNPFVKRAVLCMSDIIDRIGTVVHSLKSRDYFAPGIYNMSSINTTVEECAAMVSDIATGYINESLKPLRMVHSTGPVQYDFHLDNTKWEKSYGYTSFGFKSVKREIELMCVYHKDLIKSDRNKFTKYEGS